MCQLIIVLKTCERGNFLVYSTAA